MAPDSARPLLDRRLAIVTGKGGTGKTTVAAALALAAARSGRRVLVVEVGREEHLPRLLAPGCAPVGYTGREVAPGLVAMRIDPFDALEEYLSLQLGGRALVSGVLRNRSFRQLMEAAPGWRELITLGKVWHLEQMRDPAGGPLYEQIVVDAPATGHGVTFLDVPRVVVSAVRAGPLRRHAAMVSDMIRDAERTLLLPVALAEELPARETAELVAGARDRIGISLDRVVVNGVVPPPFPPGLEDLGEHLASLTPDLCLAPIPPPAVLARCARHLASRHRMNAGYVFEISRRCRLPVVTLPQLPDGVRGPEDLMLLGDALLGETRAEPA